MDMHTYIHSHPSWKSTINRRKHHYGIPLSPGCTCLTVEETVIITFLQAMVLGNEHEIGCFSC